MNNLPDELLLHIFTFIKVLSSELKPLLEINKSIRKFHEIDDAFDDLI